MGCHSSWERSNRLHVQFAFFHCSVENNSLARGFAIGLYSLAQSNKFLHHLFSPSQTPYRKPIMSRFPSLFYRLLFQLALLLFLVEFSSSSGRKRANSYPGSSRMPAHSESTLNKPKHVPDSQPPSSTGTNNPF